MSLECEFPLLLILIIITSQDLLPSHYYSTVKNKIYLAFMCHTFSCSQQKGQLKTVAMVGPCSEVCSINPLVIMKIAESDLHFLCK